MYHRNSKSSQRYYTEVVVSLQLARVKHIALTPRPRTQVNINVSRKNKAYQFWIQRTTNVSLFTAVRPNMDQETLSPLREPTSTTRPDVSSRIALLKAGFQIKIRRTFLWLSFQALMRKAGTLAYILRKFVRRRLRF